MDNEIYLPIENSNKLVDELYDEISKSEENIYEISKSEENIYEISKSEENINEISKSEENIDEISISDENIDEISISDENIDEISISIIQNKIYEMNDTIIKLEIENKNLKTVIDCKSKLIIDLQNSIINTTYIDNDQPNESYDEFLNYYKTNRNHIYRNIQNIMSRKGLYRTPRISENVVNTHGMKLYNDSIGKQND